MQVVPKAPGVPSSGPKPTLTDLRDKLKTESPKPVEAPVTTSTRTDVMDERTRQTFAKIIDFAEKIKKRNAQKKRDQQAHFKLYKCIQDRHWPSDDLGTKLNKSV